MKKMILKVFYIGFISIMVLPIFVSAKSISTIKTSESNGKITVSGTTENGVLAVATLVYSGDSLVYMETCSATGNSYSCVLNNTFKKGNYTVKVADYDGGNYIVDNISVDTEKNPQTGDNIITYIAIFIVSIIAIGGSVFYLNKKRSRILDMK